VTQGVGKQRLWAICGSRLKKA